MKRIILEMEESTPINANLDDYLTGCLTRVAALATVSLRKPQVQSDIPASDPFRVPKLKRGAARLAALGEPGESLVISDSLYLIDPHSAACLAAENPEITDHQREDVLTVLGFLAGMLPCWIQHRYLPPWEEIDPGSSLVRAREIYEVVRRGDSLEEGFMTIRMADVLVLRVALMLKIHPSLLLLWKELNDVTARHRHALAWLMRRTS